MTDHIDDILQSNLLERYVSGELSLEERKKVDLLYLEHGSIREKLSTLAIDKMERTSTSHAQSRECIMKDISGKNLASAKSTTNSRLNHPFWWRSIAVATIAALMTGVIMNSQITSYKTELKNQTAELADLRKDYNRVNEVYAYTSHGGTMPYLLDGSNFDKESQVVIYWNPDLQKAMLRVIDLPGIRANETYQIWADVDGEMMSLGTFDAGLAINDAIHIDYLDRASSLNITVEPDGGSDHPNLSTLTANLIM